MNLQFTIAEESDIPVILDQAKTLIEAYEDMTTIDYGKVQTWMERKITQHIGEYRCALADGKKCAYWRLCEDGELDDLYVLPEFRDMGIGTKILEVCIEESANPLYLYVFSRNIRAISFYARNGFSVREAVGKTRLIMHRNG